MHTTWTIYVTIHCLFEPKLENQPKIFHETWILKMHFQFDLFIRFMHSVVSWDTLILNINHKHIPDYWLLTTDCYCPYQIPNKVEQLRISTNISNFISLTINFK